MTDMASNKAGLGMRAKLVIACGSTIALLAFGPRSAMGFFQQPILDTTGWSSAGSRLRYKTWPGAWGSPCSALWRIVTGRIGRWPRAA